MQNQETKSSLISWQTINRLTREAGAVDRPMLASYLRWAKDERAARRTIQILRVTHPTIWTKRVTPFVER
jgi:hypothetical protein